MTLGWLSSYPYQYDSIPHDNGGGFLFRGIRLRGVVDHLTGLRNQTKKENAVETYRNAQRDQKQRDNLIFRQLEQKREIDCRNAQRLERPQATHAKLQTDMDKLNALRNKSHPSPYSRDGPER